MTERATPREDEQLDLSPSLHWQRKGSRFRKLLNTAITKNRLTLDELAKQTGIDERQIGRCLQDGGGAHPPPALVMCVLWHDEAGAFITGLAEMLGYEARPKTPDLAAENKRLREELADIKARVENVLEGR